MLLALPHGLHELVLEQPGGVVVDAKLAPQFQGRDAALGLGEEVDVEEPSGQRQLGGLEDGGRPGAVGLEQTPSAVYRGNKLMWPPENVFVFEDIKIDWRDAVVTWAMFCREAPNTDSPRK